MFADRISYLILIGCLAVILLAGSAWTLLQTRPINAGAYACYDPVPLTTDYKGSMKIYFDAYVVPSDMSHAVACLQVLLSEEELSIVRTSSEGDLILLNGGLGRFLRNAWGLWHHSEFAKWFKRNGIDFADDMSAEILVALHRELNNQPWHLGDRRLEYTVSWEEQKAQDILQLCANMDRSSRLVRDLVLRRRAHPTESNQKHKTYRRVLGIISSGGVKNEEELCLLKGYAWDITDDTFTAAERVQIEELISAYTISDASQ